MYKVLIIEDDFSICKEINTYLSKWSYECKIVKDFNNTLDGFVEFNPHLVLLDINLPFYDGFYWCQKIRDLSNVPIIYISSHDTDMDKIMGISLGGDDFITKPFSLNLLTAKIQAILRRTYSYSDSSLNIIQSGDVILNIDESVVLYNNKRQALTKNEYKILYILMKNTGKIIKRETIIEFLWEDESFVDDNTLTVNINRLRKKLSNLGINNVIVTIKSMGYKFYES